MRALTAKLLATRREADRVGRLVDQIAGRERVFGRQRFEADLEAERTERRAITTELSKALEEVRAAYAAAEGSAPAIDAEREERKTADAEIANRVAAVQTGLTGLQTASAAFQGNAAHHLEALTTALQATEAQVATLTHRLFATPYMSDPARFHQKDAKGREQLGYRIGTDSESGFYHSFAELFRGPEALIRDRQEVYLPLLRTRSHVVDIGCGRGEMLDLLKEAGVRATGVDTDSDLAAYCRSKGHTVEERGALEFLREQPPASVDAIFSAQMIEHLTYQELKEFLELSRSRLQPGGVLIAETVNPHALEAFKTFYTDLTHERPIFPEVALALSQLAGFEEGYVSSRLERESSRRTGSRGASTRSSPRHEKQRRQHADASGTHAKSRRQPRRPVAELNRRLPGAGHDGAERVVRRKNPRGRAIHRRRPAVEETFRRVDQTGPRRVDRERQRVEPVPFDADLRIAGRVGRARSRQVLLHDNLARRGGGDRFERRGEGRPDSRSRSRSVVPSAVRTARRTRRPASCHSRAIRSA